MVALDLGGLVTTWRTKRLDPIRYVCMYTVYTYVVVVVPRVMRIQELVEYADSVALCAYLYTSTTMELR
jgi:hypothetical protein